MKWIVKLLAGLCLSLSLYTYANAQIPSTLGWYQIPNTKLVEKCPSYPADTTCNQIVTAWGGGTLDTQRNRMIIWGGGHGDYFGNEVYAVNLNGTPSTERLTDPCNNSAPFAENCSEDTTQPASRHTYDFIEYMPNVDKMFSWTHAWSNQAAWTFTMSNKTWQRISIAGVPTITNVTPTAYDPNSGKVFLFDGITLVTFNPLTSQFVQVGDAYNLVEFTTAVIDPTRRKFVAIGGGDVLSFDIGGTPPYTLQTLATSGGSSIVNCNNPGVDYDPVSDRLVAWCGGSTVYSLNLDTRIWASVTYAGGPGAAQINGTFGRWRYSPALNVFVLVAAMDQNVYTFRLNNGTAPPPPPPPPAAQCSDTIDNDLDGLIDYPTDPGCSSTTDTDETNAALPPPPTSTTLQVGPDKTYVTICSAITAVQDGQIIEVDAGTYTNESCVLNKNSVLLKGINGRAHMRWGTGDYRTTTALIPNGKASLIIQGSDILIENFEFSGEKVADENGAGIRYEGGNLTIRGSYFHDNENGIMGQGGPSHTLLIEQSRFDKNGFCGNGGCAHNVYIGTMGRLIFRNNESTDSDDGSHTLKSRAFINEIYSNFLSTKNSDGSLEADFSNGGTVYFVGNTVEQGEDTSNSSLLAYGAEGASNPDKRLYITGNTFINRRLSGSLFIQTAGSPTTVIKGNTFIGPGTVPSNLNTTNTVAP